VYREELFPERDPQVVPSRVFVEIGFGESPAFLSGDPYFNNCYYDGVDQNYDKLTLAKSKIIEAGSDHLHTINLHTANLEDVDLPIEAIDEIYMANVFAPHAEAQRYAFEELEAGIIYESAEQAARTLTQIEQTNGDWVKFAPGERPFSHMLNQLGKIRSALKADGQLTIVETNTPTDAPILLEALKAFGFMPEELVTPSEEARWHELARRYSITIGITYLKQPPYILIARKS
jgi:hypothetical protein